jgi:CO/xanthine dehydrogenase FAD-binding subunit
MLRYDKYYIPKDLNEYFNLAEDIKDYRIVAGCTDTLPWARDGRAGDVYIKNIIDITKIADLNRFIIKKDKVILGSAITFQKLFLDKDIRQNVKILPQVAVWFADDQIREQATIGGNIVNASPAADGTPVFLTLNCNVNIVGQKNKQNYQRNIKLEKFILGRNNVDLKNNEIISHFELDNIMDYCCSFEKVGHRRSLVISTVCVSCVVRIADDKKTFSDVRLAVGGVSEIPKRLLNTEKFLIGKLINEENIIKASILDLDVINSRSRIEYRKEVLKNFIIRSIINSLKTKISLKENIINNFYLDKKESIYA